MLKTLLFTTELTPENLPENVTLGIIGDQEFPQDGIKRVPALKLVKAMKQMSNKEDYCVMGDPKYVEAGKKLGFSTEEPKEAEEPKPETPGTLAKMASELIAMDARHQEIEKRHEELEKKYGDAQKLEEDLRAKYEADLQAEKDKMQEEISKIKQTIKKIIKE